MSEETKGTVRPLIDIFMDIAGVENGLAYNEIAWDYTPDRLEMAMGMSHPADWKVSS